MQIRPATTYDLSDKSRICLLDLRDAPNHKLKAIRQHIRSMQPYMLIAQHNDDSPNYESLRALCEQQANQGGHQSHDSSELDRRDGGTVLSSPRGQRR